MLAPHERYLLRLNMARVKVASMKEVIRGGQSTASTLSVDKVWTPSPNSGWSTAGHTGGKRTPMDMEFELPEIKEQDGEEEEEQKSLRIAPRSQRRGTI